MSNYTGTSTLESMSQAGFYNRWTLNKFKKFLKGDILEVGCGIGNFTKTLSQYGRVTAIDIDDYLIKEAKKNGDVKIQTGYGDIEKRKYFFNNKKFDTIVCVNVLEHINDDVIALRNINKLLKKNGTLILLVPIYTFLFGEIDRTVHHYRRYNPKFISKKMELLGYRIISSRKLNFVGAIGWFISGKIFKNKQVTENKIKLFNLISPLLYLENLIEPIIGTSILIIAKKD